MTWYQPMDRSPHGVGRKLCVTACALVLTLTLAAAPVLAAASTSATAPTTSTASKTPVKQKTFATPEQAVDAIVNAAEKFDVEALKEILGPDGVDLVVTEDPVQDKNKAMAFAAKAREKKSILRDKSNPKVAILNVGNQDWPLPIPIVQKSGRWSFDSKAGRQEILYRRIGANELDALDVCHKYVEAQIAYAADLHDGSKMRQYAQRIISTPGKQDGLYWKNPDGSPGGPISEGMAKAIEEGYSPDKTSAYHGYYYHILKGQGAAAPHGEIDYVIKGMMIGGFALIATPAEYGVTGIQTFIVSADGIVYQKDLGENSLEIAKKIDRYDPDSTWQPTSDRW